MLARIPSTRCSPHSVVLESVVFGLLSAIGLGFADLTGAAVVRRLGVLRTAVVSHLFTTALLTVFLLIASDLGALSAAHWAQLAGLSVLGTFVYIAFYRALQLGPIAIVTPVVSTYAVIVILLSVVVIGERLSGGQVLAIAATIGGVVMASVDIGEIRSGRMLSRGVLIALVATVGVGVWIYAIGVVSRDLGWFLPVYINRLLTLAILAPVAAVRRSWPWQQLTVPLVLGVLVVGVLETASLMAFARGAEIGTISIVAAASTVYPVVPILGGVFIFHERLAPTQVAGLVIVVVGLVMLALAS